MSAGRALDHARCEQGEEPADVVVRDDVQRAAHRPRAHELAFGERALDVRARRGARPLADRPQPRAVVLRLHGEERPDHVGRALEVGGTRGAASRARAREVDRATSGNPVTIPPSSSRASCSRAASRTQEPSMDYRASAVMRSSISVASSRTLMKLPQFVITRTPTAGSRRKLRYAVKLGVAPPLANRSPSARCSISMA